MDRVTRPWANMNEHNKQCLSEISGKKLVVHISCTADDSTVDFTRNKAEGKHLFDFEKGLQSSEKGHTDIFEIVHSLPILEAGNTSAEATE